MRPSTWAHLALAACAHAQSTVTICESYSYTDTITLTEYTTYYTTWNGNDGTRSTTSVSTTPRSFTTSASSSSTTISTGGTFTSSTTLPTPSTTSSTSSTLISITTTTTPSTTTLTSTSPTPTNDEFYITFDTPAPPRRLLRRAEVYLAFDSDNKSIVTSDQAEAAKFYLDEDGNVRTGDQYLNIDKSSSPPRFTKQDEVPKEPVEVTMTAGQISIAGIDGYVLQANNVLALVIEGKPPPEGQQVQPAVVPVPPSSSTTTSITVTSTSQSDITSSTTTGTDTKSTTTTDGTSSTSETATTSTPSSSSSSSATTESSSTTTSSSSSTTIQSSSTTTFSTTATTTSATAEVTDKAYIDTVLRHHNAHRSNHSADPLTWDTALAETARKTAETCFYAHDTETDCPSASTSACYGQNIGAGYLSTQMGLLISNGFYNSEEPAYVPYYGGEPDLATLHAWGHFSQIVWKGTARVGCWTQDCPGGLGGIAPGSGIRPVFTVCNYGEPGNYIDEFTDNVVQPRGDPSIYAGYLCPTAENCEDGA